MIAAVLGVFIFLCAGVIVFWLLAQPGDEDEEEIAGMIAGNWNRLDPD